MNKTATDTLTFAALLADPMIREMMAADGVAVDDASRLMFRTRALLIARQATVPRGAGRVMPLPVVAHPARAASAAPAA